MDYLLRQKRLVKLVDSESLDGIIIKKKQNICYLTGTTGDDAILFFTGNKNFLITDSRYTEQCSASIKNFKVLVAKPKNLLKTISDIARKNRLRRLGFESTSITFEGYSELKKALGQARLVPAKAPVEELRAVKDKDEIKCIRKACKDASKVMDYATHIAATASFTERQVRDKVRSYMAENGFEGPAFDIIVASGKNAAMPHAPISDKKIRKGEMVVIDLGTMNCRYNSDLTRTIFLDRIDRKYLCLYNAVLYAQERAIENIKAGVKAGNIDNISRKYISGKGLGKYFIHSLGHGIGLETHEMPSLSMSSAAILQNGMVITVEPGVYIKGWGGIRIEDIALVKEDGCEVLTSKMKGGLCR